VSPADRDPSEWKLLREMCRLEMLHPNEFVVYRSVWEETDTGPVMVRREVLFHSPIMEEAQKWLMEWLDHNSIEQRYRLCFSYIEPSGSHVLNV